MANALLMAIYGMISGAVERGLEFGNTGFAEAKKLSHLRNR
jgi:hypothetical protein